MTNGKQNPYGEPIKDQSAYTLGETLKMVGAIIRYSDRLIVIKDSPVGTIDFKIEKHLFERDVPKYVRNYFKDSIDHLEKMCLNQK